MVDAGNAQPSLYIYVRNQRVAYLDNPASRTILDWLDRLDGAYVTSLVLMNRQGWLTIDNVDDFLNLSYCNSKLEISSSEVVSRQIGAAKVLQFMGHDALSAG